MSKEFRVHIHVWMKTGHEFDDYFKWQGKPSIQYLERAMDMKSRMRGYQGLDDIESFEIVINNY